MASPTACRTTGLCLRGQAQLHNSVKRRRRTGKNVNHPTNCASLILDASLRQENKNLPSTKCTIKILKLIWIDLRCSQSPRTQNSYKLDKAAQRMDSMVVGTILTFPFHFTVVHKYTGKRHGSQLSKKKGTG